jgi:hypothetical protein
VGVRVGRRSRCVGCSRSGASARPGRGLTAGMATSHTRCDCDFVTMVTLSSTVGSGRGESMVACS